MVAPLVAQFNAMSAEARHAAQRAISVKAGRTAVRQQLPNTFTATANNRSDQRNKDTKVWRRIGEPLMKGGSGACTDSRKRLTHR